jgi:hypothetical protein
MSPPPEINHFDAPLSFFGVNLVAVLIGKP